MSKDQAPPGDKAKIFISYSRKDMAFVDQLETFLKERDYEPLIDRTEIYAFEDWWKRIEGLIGQADTVIFTLSPDAVASPICAKEVAYAASLHKRFAPIVCRRVDDDAVPEPLRRLNFVFFDNPADFNVSADRLAQALQTDIGWVRKHTEYGEAARRWVATGRPSGLLLRSPALEQAERWIALRPSSAPAPTTETQEFIGDSRRGATRRRNILTGSLAAGLVVALALAGVAYWQRSVAIAQRHYAEQALDAGIRTSNSMALDLAMKLRHQTGMPSELVKYLLDSALVLETKLGSLGRSTPELLNGEGAALLQVSKTRRAMGDVTGGLEAAQRAHKIFTRLLAGSPADASTQLNVSVSDELTGDLLLAEGKIGDALAAYRAAVAAAQAVTDADSKNEDAQRELAIDEIHVGDALNSELKSDEALAAYQKSLAVRQKFVLLHPSDTAWKRGLGISYERIAEVLSAQHKADAALSMAEKRRAVAQELADANRSDSEFQRELSVADNQLGGMLLAAQKPATAVGYFKKSLAIRQTLADSDKDNAIWQRDVAISNNDLGDALSAEGKTDAALAAYEKGLAIEKKLSSADQNNLRWQADVAISDTRIGDLLKNAGKLAPAQQVFDDCAAIAQRATKINPGDSRWPSELRLCVAQIGFLSYRFVMAHDFAGGLQAAEQAISLQPDMIWLYAHQAHALMLLHRTDEARALYLKYRSDKNVFGTNANPITWSALILREFSELRNAGLSDPLMDEIEKTFGSG
jgi:tetratricopeptide (TPR) repeat protein